MEYHLKRPKRAGEEDEDDLLAFQEAFLKNKSEQPAAKVIKTNQNRASDDTNSNQDARQSQSQILQSKNKIEIDCKFNILFENVIY
jgi:hypothetical protein